MLAPPNHPSIDRFSNKPTSYWGAHILGNHILSAPRNAPSTTLFSTGQLLRIAALSRTPSPQRAASWPRPCDAGGSGIARTRPALSPTSSSPDASSAWRNVGENWGRPQVLMGNFEEDLGTHGKTGELGHFMLAFSLFWF